MAIACGLAARGESHMDFNSVLNYAYTLALLYAWTLFAAGAFAIGERIVHRAYSRQASRPGAGDRSAG
jgi:hypothetical protein